MSRIIIFAAAILITASPSLASEPNQARAPETESGAGALSQAPAELGVAQIFEILCGGMEPGDNALTAHLWRIAESLAQRSWTPPTVSVRSVARPAAD
jgi:hypothetical protein